MYLMELISTVAVSLFIISNGLKADKKKNMFEQKCINCIERNDPK